MSPTRFPAGEVPHPSVFVAEEVAARGWTPDELALRLGGYRDMNVLALCMYFAVGPTHTNCRIGDSLAAALDRAFDVSPGYFLNLEAAWLRNQEPEA